MIRCLRDEILDRWSGTWELGPKYGCRALARISAGFMKWGFTKL